ncbi:hypothetical protein HNW77_01545 [Komagataeibacter sp. AV436]|uniref:ISXO2-like transposase domain-containing protein n=1 Tax=Komagataeibacter melomenusus TaxID=2766578 RepID=A0ABX2A9Y8_9PROT|nr:hypothetical protein [Komagataeibacter melomenusus]NPC65110.1 hypothetical protein [Komagataeibacter melomenusus]
MAVFGLLKRHDRVHAVMIPNAGHQALMSIIGKKMQPNSIVYSDSWHACNKLDVSEFHHERILPWAETTSTASRISGTRRSGICGDTMEYHARTSTSSAPRASGASTSARLQNS